MSNANQRILDKLDDSVDCVGFPDHLRKKELDSRPKDRVTLSQFLFMVRLRFLKSYGVWYPSLRLADIDADLLNRRLRLSVPAHTVLPETEIPPGYTRAVATVDNDVLYVAGVSLTGVGFGEAIVGSRKEAEKASKSAIFTLTYSHWKAIE